MEPDSVVGVALHPYPRVGAGVSEKRLPQVTEVRLRLRWRRATRSPCLLLRRVTALLPGGVDQRPGKERFEHLRGCAAASRCPHPPRSATTPWSGSRPAGSTDSGPRPRP